MTIREVIRQLEELATVTKFGDQTCCVVEVEGRGTFNVAHLTRDPDTDGDVIVIGFNQ